MKPSAIQNGDAIGIIAPSSAPLEAERLERGLQTLKHRGFQVVRYRPDYPQVGYLAGTDDDRINELNAALTDPGTSFVFCVRGGYGSLRILDRIDFQAASQFPNVLVGYSDITALQMALWKRSGIRGLSGSMVAVDWTEPHKDTERLFWRFLDSQPPIVIPDSDHPLNVIRDGQAEGLLLGGNMSMITRLIGTPYLPDLTGAILFLEDVSEPPYRIDALFAHLKLSGILDKLAGLVLGHFSGWIPDNDRPTLSYEDVIGHYTKTLDIPVVSHLPYGHTCFSYALPIGVMAHLDARQPSPNLTILESLTT